ncbi:MAG: GNAT family N-acetyltransferase [Oscillospiraceae bacterium]
MTLANATQNDIEFIKKIYDEAFPKSEKKPFNVIEKKAEKGTVEILVIKNDKPLGLVITAIYEDCVLIDYFAIDKNCRGNGVGSEAIRLIKEKYSGKKIFLEIERLDETAENNNQRIKRKNFYIKNGLVETGAFARAFGIPMEILSFGEKVTFEDYHKTFRKVFGFFPSLVIKKIK